MPTLKEIEVIKRDEELRKALDRLNSVLRKYKGAPSLRASIGTDDSIEFRISRI